MAETRPGDPAYWMKFDRVRTAPRDTPHRQGCYICEDPEFVQMGLPLCYFCPKCKTGHVPADDVTCDDCGHEASPEDYEEPE